MDGIWASVSGLRAAFTRVSNSAHNLANINTPGFQPRRMEQATAPGGGTRISASTALPRGPVVQSEGPLDMAINGRGFFMVQDPSGEVLYTRAGNFSLNAQGQLVDTQGRPLVPQVQIPAEATQVEVTPEGQVRAYDSSGQVIYEGQIETATFANPGGLEPVGGNAYRATEASGPPAVDTPGAGAHGRIVQGAVEASGTDPLREMVNMMVNQRSAEANMKAVRTQDEMTSTVIDLVE